MNTRSVIIPAEHAEDVFGAVLNEAVRLFRESMKNKSQHGARWQLDKATRLFQRVNAMSDQIEFSEPLKSGLQIGLEGLADLRVQADVSYYERYEREF